MTNLKFAEGLRALADLYERHPEMLVPDHGLSLYMPYDTKSENLRATIKAFTDGGTVHKDPSDEYYYRLHRFFGVLEVTVNVERSVFCKKVTRMKMVETWECPDSILEGLEPEK
jgi:hypothetical protein